MRDDVWVSSLGACLVVAPHPDDESIGCGGLLALLRRTGLDVQVVLISDGTMSHPASRAYPAAARRQVRESEMREALQLLGISHDCLHALGYPDGCIPGSLDAAFASAVDAVLRIASACRANTVIAPWRRDPHTDHQAASEIARHAAQLTEPAKRLIEYIVWTEERGTARDLPQPGEAICRQLDISAVLPQKLAAIRAHRSQFGMVFTDDPGGFALSRAMVERCAWPAETYFEVSVIGVSR